MSDPASQDALPKSKPPGLIRRALFLDVPFIIDSQWRWVEFRANRLGTVGYSGNYDFKLRSSCLSSAYVLFVIVTLFLIFGPTPDAWCAIGGPGSAAELRKWGAIGLALIAVVIFFRRLNETMAHLKARAGRFVRGEPEPTAEDQLTVLDEGQVSDDAASAKPASAAPAANAAEQPTNRARVQTAAQVVNREVGLTFSNYGFFKLLGGVRAKNPGEFWALMLTFAALVIGSLIVIGPLVAIAITLWTGEIDPQSCPAASNQGNVVAQFVVAALTVLVGGILWHFMGKTRTLLLFFVSSALWVVAIAVLWKFYTPPQPSEAEGGFYPHLYVVIVGGLLLVAIFSRGFAWLMLRGYFKRNGKPEYEGAKTAYREALKKEDLLEFDRRPPNISGVRLWSAFVNGVTGHPLHFLLLPCFVAFITPTRLMWGFTLFFAGLSVWLLMYASLSTRWNQTIVYVDRWFLVGSPLVVSILVIVVGLCRLADVQYVSTVLDATPVGTLFIIVAMMYAALWFFEYWVNRWLAEKFLGILGNESGKIGYLQCDYVHAGKKPSWARNTGRYVAMHGVGRLVAQGWFTWAVPLDPDRANAQAFSTYSFGSFFARLGKNIGPHGDDLAHDMNRRVRLYFTGVNFMLVGLAVGLWLWQVNESRPSEVVSLVDAAAIKPELGNDPKPDPLAQRLLLQTSLERPSLIVAASGGGTRAAVYTAVALEGLAHLDRTEDILLLSGVSGGGVAAAVFASRYEKLKDPHNQKEWTQYVDVVSQPFIQDVLEGIGDLRVAGSASLGELLEESLERRAFKGHVREFGSLADEGPRLILNTTITGHPYNDAELLRGRVAKPRGNSCQSLTRPYASLAGGRLIFTNLQNMKGFPTPYEQAADIWLPYRIVNDGSVDLAAASALTANFPPVFSNARVQLATQEVKGCKGLSYYVTDGGATENLGLVSALYALRGSLERVREGTHLSPVHIVALEASAIDYDYQDDRGIGAATGGSKERINAGLTQMLLKEIETRLREKHTSELKVHYLPLPVGFRSRGGFGTHWMFARNVRVLNPHLVEVPGFVDFLKRLIEQEEHVDLNQKEVMTTWRALFDTQARFCPQAEAVRENRPQPLPEGWSDDVQQVARWICGVDDLRKEKAQGPDYQIHAWQKLVAALGTKP